MSKTKKSTSWRSKKCAVPPDEKFLSRKPSSSWKSLENLTTCNGAGGKRSPPWDSKPSEHRPEHPTAPEQYRSGFGGEKHRAHTKARVCHASSARCSAEPTLSPIPSITERSRQIFTHPAKENDFTQELKALPCQGCLFSNKSPLFSLFLSSEQNQRCSELL